MASFTISQSAATVVGRAQSTSKRAQVQAVAGPSVKLGARSAVFNGSTKFSKAASSKISATRGPSFVVRAARFETERTYVMVKPDGVQRGLVGNICSRFETKGFQLKAMKLFQCPKELAEEHYGDLSERPFFPDLVDYIISAPVCCMVWEGPGVVKSARKLIGATNPLESEPGTIRGDLAIEVGRNVVHGSDSVENAEKEIGLWFAEGEVLDWEQSALGPWLRE